MKGLLAVLIPTLSIAGLIVEAGAQQKTVI